MHLHLLPKQIDRILVQYTIGKCGGICRRKTKSLLRGLTGKIHPHSGTSIRFRCHIWDTGHSQRALVQRLVSHQFRSILEMSNP